MAVITYVDADLCECGIKRRITEVARFEIKLLPESGVYVWDVVLSILAEILAVGVNHRGSVVVNSGDLFFVNRHYDNHPVCLGHFLHQPDGWPIGDSFHSFIPARLLFGAEVRRSENFLHANYLHSLCGSFLDETKMLLKINSLDIVDRQISGCRICALNQPAFNCTWHLKTPSDKSRNFG